MQPKCLSQIFAEFPFKYSSFETDPLVTNVTGDSRQIQPGSLFVAIKGKAFDGHKFIPDVIENGAVAVVGTQPFLSDLTVPYIRVENSRQAISLKYFSPSAARSGCAAA